MPQQRRVRQNIGTFPLKQTLISRAHLKVSLLLGQGGLGQLKVQCQEDFFEGGDCGLDLAVPAPKLCEEQRL